jgi:hypothetical protein
MIAPPLLLVLGLAAGDMPAGVWKNVEVLDLACARTAMVKCQRDNMAGEINKQYAKSAWCLNCGFPLEKEVKPFPCSTGKVFFELTPTGHAPQLKHIRTDCVDDGEVLREYVVTVKFKGGRGITRTIEPSVCATGAFMTGGRDHEPFRKCTQRALTLDAANELERAMTDAAVSVKMTTSSMESAVAKRLADFEKCLNEAKSGNVAKTPSVCANP